MADMETRDTAEKTSWINKIWPVQIFELKKVVPLLFLKFLVSFVYSTITNMKDSLIITADQSGAEVIPVLKGWIVFPLSLLCAVAYSKLSNRFKRSTLFYSIIFFFLVIIFLYGFVLYPNIGTLSPHESANLLTAKFGVKFSYWISVYRNWVHSLFFVTAELWAQVVIFILYWGFANHICQVNEAKRTYTLFIAAGDLATIAAGPLILYYVSKFTGGDFTGTLQTLITYVLIAGVMILGVYWWLNRYVLSDVRYFNPSITKHTLNEKTKMTLRKSIKHIFSSKYLLSIAVLVIGCAFTINIVEVSWKAHVKTLYPNTADYIAFNAKVTTIIGVVALFTVVLLGGNFLRRFGWRFSALITPIAVGASGAIFFALSYYKGSLGPFAALLGTTPLILIVFMGAFQSITSKVVKYSFFDSTKEMAYIPLDQESKVKGKAAIDMVGSRLGKSSSSWVQVGMMAAIGTGSVLMITPYLIPIVLGVALYWSHSVRYLSTELDVKENAVLGIEKAAEDSSAAAEPTPVG